MYTRAPHCHATNLPHPPSLPNWSARQPQLHLKPLPRPPAAPIQPASHPESDVQADCTEPSDGALFPIQENKIAAQLASRSQSWAFIVGHLPSTCSFFFSEKVSPASCLHASCRADHMFFPGFGWPHDESLNLRLHTPGRSERSLANYAVNFHML